MQKTLLYHKPLAKQNQMRYNCIIIFNIIIAKADDSS